MVPLFGAAYDMLHQIKAPQIYTDLGLKKQCWILLQMVKFKDFSRPLSVFKSTFQGKFHFQGLFKMILYIQVLFKPVQTVWTLTTHWVAKIANTLIYIKIGRKACA